MIHIKRFIDKIALSDSRQGKDVVMTIADARGLRDELTKMIADNYSLLEARTKTPQEAVVQIEIVGGKF